MTRKLLNYSKNIDFIINKGLQFIDENPRIVKGAYKHISYNDEPKLYGYTVHFKDKHNNAENESGGAAGVSFNRKKALLKVLGETVERYSLSTNNNKKLIHKSFKELIKLKEYVLSPKNFVMCPDDKDYINSLSRKKLHWVKGRFLTSNKQILIPAQAVYVPYVYYSSEPVLRFNNSTGAAAGTALNEALYRGICETVERDAFMISYLNKLSSPRINLSSIKDKTICDIVSLIGRYKLDLVILDLTTDLQIPVFAAITLDKTGVGPAVSVGLKAGFNIKETIAGAVEESLMVRLWTRDEFANMSSKYMESNMVKTIEDRARFWFPISAIKYLNFWLTSKNLKKINLKKQKYLNNNLERAIFLLKEKGMEAIYIDITDDKVREYGFVVVKLIIPELHPLYLDEREAYLSGERLYKTPVKMGLLQTPKTESQLNKIPHPFL